MLLALGTPKLVERCTAVRGVPGLLWGWHGEGGHKTPLMGQPTLWTPGLVYHDLSVTLVPCFSHLWLHPLSFGPFPQRPDHLSTPSTTDPEEPSFSSFSIMALRAWDAEVLGRLCAFMSSFFFSAWRFSRAARLPERELVWSSRSKILEGDKTDVRLEEEWVRSLGSRPGSLAWWRWILEELALAGRW